MFRFILPVFLLAAVCFAENPLANFHRSENFVEDSHKIESHFKDVLKTGIPEWKLPILEPFNIDEVVVDLPDFKVNIKYSNIKIEGASSAKTVKFYIDPKAKKAFHDYELTNLKIVTKIHKVFMTTPVFEEDYDITIVLPKVLFSIFKEVTPIKGLTVDEFDIKVLAKPEYELPKTVQKDIASSAEISEIIETAHNSPVYAKEALKPILVKFAENLGEYYRLPLVAQK